MPIKIAPLAEDAANGVYVVKPPRVVDALNGALRSAFSDNETGWDEFAALLHKIDRADQARFAA